MILVYGACPNMHPKVGYQTVWSLMRKEWHYMFEWVEGLSIMRVVSQRGTTVSLL